MCPQYGRAPCPEYPPIPVLSLMAPVTSTDAARSAITPGPHSSVLWLETHLACCTQKRLRGGQGLAGVCRDCTQGNRGLSAGSWSLFKELGPDPCSQAWSFCCSTQSGSLPLTPLTWSPTPVFPKPSAVFLPPLTGGLADLSSLVSPVLTFSPLPHLGLQSL